MKFLAVLDEAAFNELPDATVLGKDGFIKDEKTNSYKLAMDGEEAGKLALPLQQQLDNKKTELTKIHGEKNELATKLKAYEDLGKPVDEIKTLLETGKQAGVKEIEDKYESQISSLKTSHEQALTAARTEIEAAKTEAGEIEKSLVSTIKKQTLAELKNEFGIANGGEDFFANRIEVVKDPDTGKYVERVIENGEVAYKAGSLKTAKQLAEEIRANKDYANLFTAGTAAGSGAPARQGGGVTAGQIAVSREASKANPSLYEQAKAKAAETGGSVVWTD